MKRKLIRGFVALCDGWPKPCKLVKTCLQNLGLMYGLVCPVNTSHHTRILSKVLINWKSNVVDGKCLNRVNSAARAWYLINSLELITEALPIADTDNRDNASATKFVSHSRIWYLLWTLQYRPCALFGEATGVRLLNLLHKLKACGQYWRKNSGLLNYV